MAEIAAVRPAYPSKPTRPRSAGDRGSRDSTSPYDCERICQSLSRLRALGLALLAPAGLTFQEEQRGD